MTAPIGSHSDAKSTRPTGIWWANIGLGISSAVLVALAFGREAEREHPHQRFD